MAGESAASPSRTPSRVSHHDSPLGSRRMTPALSPTHLSRLPPCHSLGLSHPLLHPLPHSHPASWQGCVTTQPPMTQTSPGTVLRPANGMGTLVHLPLNTHAPGKPKSTTMGAILTTLT